jgi:hypothetical protein
MAEDSDADERTLRFPAARTTAVTAFAGLGAMISPARTAAASNVPVRSREVVERMVTSLPWVGVSHKVRGRRCTGGRRTGAARLRREPPVGRRIEIRTAVSWISRLRSESLGHI